MYIPSPNQQKKFSQTMMNYDEIIDDEIGKDYFKMFSAHGRLLGPKIKI